MRSEPNPTIGEAASHRDPPICADLQFDDATPGGPRYGELHIWHVDLSAPWCEPTGVALSPDENERAQRFVFERDRQRFRAARASLRWLLGNYLGGELPSDSFEYGPQGKPSLRVAPFALSHGLPLEFNLSHSGDAALIAVRRGGAVGVDLELERDNLDFDGVGRLVFTPPECAVLDALPLAEKRHVFFRFWARKEAFLKCVGWGLGGRIEARTVTVNPQPGALVTLPGYTTAHPRLTLVDVPVRPGYAAAVATWQDCDRIRIGPLNHSRGSLRDPAP